MKTVELLYKCRLCGTCFGSGAKTSAGLASLVFINMEQKLVGKDPTVPMVGEAFARPFHTHRCSYGPGTAWDPGTDIGLADFVGLRESEEL